MKWKISAGKSPGPSICFSYVHGMRYVTQSFYPYLLVFNTILRQLLLSFESRR